MRLVSHLAVRRSTWPSASPNIPRRLPVNVPTRRKRYLRLALATWHPCFRKSRSSNAVNHQSFHRSASCRRHSVDDHPLSASGRTDSYSKTISLSNLTSDQSDRFLIEFCVETLSASRFKWTTSAKLTSINTVGFHGTGAWVAAAKVCLYFKGFFPSENGKDL